MGEKIQVACVCPMQNKTKQPIKFVDNAPMIRLQKSDFETYTTNEIQTIQK